MDKTIGDILTTPLEEQLEELGLNKNKIEKFLDLIKN